MKVKRYKEYGIEVEMANHFINSFDGILVESEDSPFKEVAKKVASDLKLNVSLISTFGAGIGALYPVVDKLMKNMNIDSFNLSSESIVLLTLASFTILYLEEKKSKDIEEEELLTKDAKSMLEELKLRGFGNGIVKKLIKSIKSIKNIFNLIGKHIGAVISGTVDMFAYTSLLIPVMNGILALIGKYDLNMDTLIQNLVGVAAGVVTIIAKHGVLEIIKRLKNKFSIDKEEVLDVIENDDVQKFSTFADGEESEQSGDLIKEQ